MCCSKNTPKSLFYPLSHYYDNSLYSSNTNSNSDEFPNYFKINRLMPDDELEQARDCMKLECVIDSRKLRHNSTNQISTLACSNSLLACGTFEGGYLLKNIESPDAYPVEEHNLTKHTDGITNQIVINDERELLISSNDNNIRIVDVFAKSTDTRNLPFAINCLSVNPHNHNEYFVTGDNVNSYILDKRMSWEKFDSLPAFIGHQDFGFACDWSPKDENLLVTGNQDCSVKLWDRRNSKESLFCWDSSLGGPSLKGGPVRNCKFNDNGDHLTWAESLDHVGIIQVDDLMNSKDYLLRIQSIDFVGKCSGISYSPMEAGYGEDLIIGINDCPLGGILTCRLEDSFKSLDFDFFF